MGEHFSQLKYQFNQTCRDVLPVAVLYNEGIVVGFVWIHLVNLPGDRFDTFLAGNMIYMKYSRDSYRDFG